jgi:arylformamidase
LKNGKGIDEMALEHFVGECYVAEHRGDVKATDAREILEKARKVGAGKRVLIKGEATVTEEAAQVFANAEILLLGNESQSVGPENAPMSVHKILLSKNIALLEGIVLDNAREGRYILNCAPLNIKGFEGSPCRAILVEE